MSIKRMVWPIASSAALALGSPGIPAEASPCMAPQSPAVQSIDADRSGQDGDGNTPISIEDRWLAPTDLATTALVRADLEAGRGAATLDLGRFEPDFNNTMSQATGYPVDQTGPDPACRIARLVSAQADLLAQTEGVSIPEPASLVLVGTGLVGLWARRQLRRRGQA